MINRDGVLTWLRNFRQVIADNKDYLTQLDSAIGDADHGINMDRGFGAVVGKLDGAGDLDIAGVFKSVGMTLISTVGGAGGPLYGTLFLRAGAAAAGKSELDAADLLAMLTAGLEGIQQRGKAAVGEKTMVDALTPARDAMQAAVARGGSIGEALEAAADGAEQGMKGTIPTLATKGRASYLGERSIGHQDPGSTSSYLMLRCAADTWKACP